MPFGKNKEGLPSSYYEAISKHNPVIDAFIAEYDQLITKISNLTLRDSTQRDISFAKISTVVNNLWNRFAHRLPVEMYHEKILNMGELLFKLEIYRVAYWQCFHRYLKWSTELSINIDETPVIEFVTKTQDVNESVIINFMRAHLGKLICEFYIAIDDDANFQNDETIFNVEKILERLQYFTHFLLSRETYYWLLYNGTVHIYMICRRLMVHGHSSRALEYLIWASTVMESSIPLLSIRYLNWRTILYTAVSQAYLDIKANSQAEAYARRSMQKLEELSQLEQASKDFGDLTSVPIFRLATLRLALFSFPNHARDAKRRARNAPNRSQKMKNAKEIVAATWPRTSTEKALNELFEGSASQMFVIIQILSDPNKRTFHSQAKDPDDLMAEVIVDLFIAGAEIISGGGGNNGFGQTQGGNWSLNGLQREMGPQHEMAANGIDGVTLEIALKFVKLCYMYEQWDIFIPMATNLLAFLKTEEDRSTEQFIVRLLFAMEQINSNARRHRKFLQLAAESAASFEATGQEMPTVHQLQRQGKSPKFKKKATTKHVDISAVQALQTKKPETVIEYLVLSEVLLEAIKFKQNQLDMDMIVDCCLFLWSKCRAVFKLQTGALIDAAGYARAIQKIENPQKYMKLMMQVYRVMCWSRLGDFDASSVAEAGMRVGYTLEVASDHIQDNSILIPEGMPKSRIELLRQATIRVKEGLDAIVRGKDSHLAEKQWRTIADVSWLPLEKEEKEHRFNSVLSTTNDLHCELLLIYHRLCIKYGHYQKLKDEKNAREDRKKGIAAKDRDYIEEFEQASLPNPVSHVFFLLSKGFFFHKVSPGSGKVSASFEEAFGVLEKIKEEEETLYKINLSGGDALNVKKSRKVPPPPVLLKRSATYLVFEPAQFNSTTSVAWYKPYCKQITGPDCRVRFNDNQISGTGYEIPWKEGSECKFIVRNLIPGERYVTGVAAYDENGQIIGGGVGESTKPIVAYQPLPLLTVYAFLTQIAYQSAQYNVAKKSFQILWNNFIEETREVSDVVTYRSCRDNDFKLILYRVKEDAVNMASPILKRLFLITIFISVDMSIKKGQLYPTQVCDGGVAIYRQMNRFVLCQQLLMAVELSGSLNDAPLACQAIIQMYGLIAPLLHNKIPSLAVVQIMVRIHAVLSELPISLLVWKQQTVTDSIHHMIACVTYHICRLLRLWKQRLLAAEINLSGKKLLLGASTPQTRKQLQLQQQANISSPRLSTPDASSAISERTKDMSVMDEEEAEAEGFILLYHGEDAEALDDDAKDGPDERAANTKIEETTVEKTKKKKEKENPDEEVKALQATMLKLSKSVNPSDELYGSEDPTVLYAYVSCLPSKNAYKEVLKFKRRPAFIEFLVQVVDRAICEGTAPSAIEWCEDAFAWFTKRHEQLIPKEKERRGRGGKSESLAPHGAEARKYGASITEFSRKDDESQAQASTDIVDNLQNIPTIRHREGDMKGRIRRRNKLNYFLKKFHPKLSDADRQMYIENDDAALEHLEEKLPRLWRMHIKRKRLRRISFEEFPWRSQLNALYGVCLFSNILQNINEKNEDFSPPNAIYSTSFLDQTDMMMDFAGRLVIGWQADAAAQTAAIPDVKTALEFAAAMAIGKRFIKTPIVEEQPLEDVEGPPDTPRTYFSETSDAATEPPRKIVENKPVTPDATTFVDHLGGKLSHLFKAFARSVELAARGRLWILLQNNLRLAFNSFNAILLHLCHESHLTAETLRNTACKSFSLMSYSTIYMLTTLQIQWDDINDKLKPKQVDMNVFPTKVMGTQDDEVGGSRLNFDKPVDDVTIIDAKFCYKFLLRTFDLLHGCGKWEQLVDLAFKFNAISNNRYVEQVSPLLVYAQHRLIDRVCQTEGQFPPQLSFKGDAGKREAILPIERYQPFTFSVKYPKERLDEVPVVAEELTPQKVSPPDALRSVQLCSVPLDIGNSLQQLSAAIDRSQFTSHGLRHTRRLLALYIGGQGIWGGMRTKPSVAFAEGAQNAGMTTVADDLKALHFDRECDVRLSVLPKNQIATVIASYHHTIELLAANKEHGLQAQAMHELGNLYFHNNQPKQARTWWTDALDKIFKERNSIDQFSKLFPISTPFESSLNIAKKCGVWGALLAGIIFVKIARYLTYGNIGKRHDLYMCASLCFKALFRSSFPHPTADADYATYAIGYVVPENVNDKIPFVIPGLDITSDKFRCDAKVLLSACLWLAEELHQMKENLVCLPILCIAYYLSCDVCRDVRRTVQTRLLKVQVLSSLKMFGPASSIMIHVLYGEQLPQLESSDFIPVEQPSPSVHFKSGKPITDVSNLKVIEILAGKKMSPHLLRIYGPFWSCWVSVVQSQLRTAIASVLNVLPLDVVPEIKDECVEEEFVKKKKKPKRVGGRTVDQLLAKIDEEDGSDDGEDSNDINHPLSSGRGSVTDELVKGFLLQASHSTLLNIVESLEGSCSKSVFNLRPSELVVLLESKICLAKIAFHKQCSTTAAKILVEVISILKETPILKGKLRNSELVDMNEYIELWCCSILDCKLWMRVRLMLVKVLLFEIREVGPITGDQWESNVGSCRQHCAEGVAECEKFGSEMILAEFLYYVSILDIKDGKHISQIMENLKDCKACLSKSSYLSPHFLNLKIRASILHADLENTIIFPQSVAEDGSHLLSHVEDLYRKCDEMSLELAIEMGEIVENRLEIWRKSTILQPIKNIYTHYVTLLAHTKLRVAHTWQRIVNSKQSTTPSFTTLNDIVDVLQTAEFFSFTSAWKEPSLQSEIIFNIGLIQKHFFLNNDAEAQDVAVTFLKTIMLSLRHTHDIGLIHKCYMEIASIYFGVVGVAGVELPLNTEPVAPENIFYKEQVALAEKKDAREASPSKKRVAKDLWRSTAASVKSRGVRRITEQQKKEKAEKEAQQRRVAANKRAACGALKCALITTDALKELFILPADEEVLKSPFATALPELPVFCFEDLAFSHGIRIGDKEVPPKPRSEFTDHELIYGQDCPPPLPSVESNISWVHVLSYQSVLNRLSSMHTVARSGTLPDNLENTSHISESSFAFYNHEDLELGFEETLLQTPIYGALFSLRKGILHQFLKRFLSPYAKKCCSPMPPSQFLPNDNYVKIIGLDKNEIADSEKTPIYVDGELNVQWKFDIKTVGNTDEVALLYTIAKKLEKKGKEKEDTFITSIGALSLNLSSVTLLHDKLMTLLQRADVQLAAVEKIAKKSKKTNVSKSKQAKAPPPPPDIKKDDKLEDLFKDCLGIIMDMFRSIDDGLERSAEMPDIPTQVPIVREIEKIFNVGVGNSITSAELFTWFSNMLVPPPPTALDELALPPASQASKK